LTGDRVRRIGVLVAVVWCAAAQAAPGRPTSARLLEGVRAFQAADYARALEEFTAVQQARDAPPDVAFYLGPTLYKLGRYEDALEVLAPSRGSDGLADFYLGQTYYQLRLYRQARGVFAALRGRGLGPRLGAAADAYVTLVDQLFAAAPVEPAVDAYLERGRALLGAGRPRSR
jgi:tetratricopeptide (TPR) repeat protein